MFARDVEKSIGVVNEHMLARLQVKARNGEVCGSNRKQYEVRRVRLSKRVERVQSAVKDFLTSLFDAVFH